METNDGDTMKKPSIYKSLGTFVIDCPQFLHPTKLGPYYQNCRKCEYYNGDDGAYIRCQLYTTPE